jgi:double zinc ribbon protein
MKCPRCQYENRPQAKFCEQCATPLSRTCSNCSTPLSPTAKFCPECAHPIAAGGTELRFASPDSYTPKHLAEKILTSKSALEGERKQVTVLFVDVSGFTSLSERLVGHRTSRRQAWNGWAPSCRLPRFPRCEHLVLGAVECHAPEQTARGNRNSSWSLAAASGQV